MGQFVQKKYPTEPIDSADSTPYRYMGTNKVGSRRSPSQDDTNDQGAETRLRFGPNFV